MRLNRAGTCLLLFAGALAAPVVVASSLRVSPVRIEIAHGQRAATLQVSNRGDQPVLAEIAAHSWRQADDGQDVLEPTTDLIISPPVFRLPAGGTQTVRIGPKKPARADRETSYRLFVTEVADQTQSPGLKFQLRLSLPVFIKPRSEARRASARQTADTLLLTNTGNRHILLTELSATAGGDTVPIEVPALAYLLPGTTAAYPLPRLLQSRGIETLTLQTRKGTLNAPVTTAR